VNNKTKNRNFKLTVALATAAIIIIGASSFILLPIDSKQAANTDISHKITPMFSFSGASNWRQGPTNETSMALFSKARPDGTSACFTSAEFKHGVVNANTEIEKLQNDLGTTGGNISLLSTTPGVLHTKNGDKSYELHQYKIEGGSGSKDAMQGLELGYVQLQDGYVKLAGHCETTDDLADVTPALQAYRLNK
jgi:hypothetical protein